MDVHRCWDGFRTGPLQTLCHRCVQRQPWTAGKPRRVEQVALAFSKSINVKKHGIIVGYCFVLKRLLASYVVVNIGPCGGVRCSVARVTDSSHSIGDPCLRPRRPLCQHRPWQLLHPGWQDCPEASWTWGIRRWVELNKMHRFLPLIRHWPFFLSVKVLFMQVMPTDITWCTMLTYDFVFRLAKWHALVRVAITQQVTVALKYHYQKSKWFKI